MAVTFQQQSRRRKLIYAVIIMLLLTGMVIHRHQVKAYAEEHDLQEVDLGQVDLGGSAARYALASFRGPLICALWWEASERQKEHDWPQLSLLIDTLTKLQPRFRQPWVYQAWNLAYNVSVEFDRVQDKYFFIAEGTQLLERGEAINRVRLHVTDPSHPRYGQKIERGDPTMRWSLGFYQQQKVGVSDEANFFRCFFQLSCIERDKWDPAVLQQDPQRLEEFKQDYPRFMNRFRILKRIPQGAENQLNSELLTFLETFRQLPSVHGSTVAGPGSPDRASPAPGRFPIWPRHLEPANPGDEPQQDAYLVSAAWYEFGQSCLRPPTGKAGPTMPVARTERLYTMPKMHSLLYRSSPPRALSLLAAQLAKEGLFHGEGGSRLAWSRAWQRWKQFGIENGLYLTPQEMAALEKQAALFRERYPLIAQSEQPLPAREADNPDMIGSFQAHLQLKYLGMHRETSRFDHWETLARVSSGPEQTKALEHCFRAGHHYRADLLLARAEYEKAFDIWKQLMNELGSNPRLPFLLELGPAGAMGAAYCCQPTGIFERSAFGQDRQIQEDLIELQTEYLRVWAKCHSAWVAVTMATGELLQLLGRPVAAPAAPCGGLGLIPWSPLGRPIERIEDLLKLLPGPLDPYLDADLRQRLRPAPNEDMPSGGPPTPVMPTPAGQAQ